MPIEIRQLTVNDIPLLEAMLKIFGEAFNEIGTYIANRPTEGYLRRLLGGESFIALASLKHGDVVGGSRLMSSESSNRSAVRYIFTTLRLHRDIGAKKSRQQ